MFQTTSIRIRGFGFLGFRFIWLLVVLVRGASFEIRILDFVWKLALKLKNQ